MKRIVALVILTALAFVVAGCASGHKDASNVTTVTSPHSIVDVSRSPKTLVVSGTATIPHVPPGTFIRCKGGQTVTVTKSMRGLDGSSTSDYGLDEAGGTSGSTRRTSIKLRHYPNGTVAVTCA